MSHSQGGPFFIKTLNHMVDVGRQPYEEVSGLRDDLVKILIFLKNVLKRHTHSAFIDVYLQICYTPAHTQYDHE